jgi:hypothetical protein
LVVPNIPTEPSHEELAVVPPSEELITYICEVDENGEMVCKSWTNIPTTIIHKEVVIPEVPTTVPE